MKTGSNASGEALVTGFFSCGFGALLCAAGAAGFAVFGAVFFTVVFCISFVAGFVLPAGFAFLDLVAMMSSVHILS